MFIISGGHESDRERQAPGDWPTPEQSRRKLTLAIPTKRTRHVPFPAHAKFAEIRFDSFVSIQSLQSPEEHREQGQIQISTRYRSYRMA
jgi:hypothetical protein